uniref:Uncharacterized protein n=1 Tax=Anguilla anguilla TaxID=7936 RepID=A0A0E9S6Y1_ANGAN
MCKRNTSHFPFKKKKRKS